MCKRNSYLFFFVISLTVISFIFISNKYLLFIFSVLYLSTDVGKNHPKVGLLSLFCTVFNIFCGKLMLFCKILLLFDTLLWITQGITKKDFITLCGNFFRNETLKKVILTLIYFPRVFIKEINYDDGETKFFRIINEAYKRSKKDMKKIFNQFSKRFYFNKKSYFDRNICNYDILSTVVVILIFFVSISL